MVLWLTVCFFLALLLVYFAVELGWGGARSDYDEHWPYTRGDPFPCWRPWRPSSGKPKDPDPTPKPAPRKAEPVE